jgi:TolB-like protein/Flp pilus assembly protein TadD
MRSNTACLRFGPFQLDPSERLFLRGDREIHLASKLFDTLLFLVQNAGRLVEKEALMRSVWRETFVEESSLTHSVSVLRKLLNDGREGNRYIETVPRHGYRFVAPVELYERAIRGQADSGRQTLHSLAVLPLVSLSRGKNQDYFAHGMTEALITELAQITPLRVISRTSVMAYANARKPLPQIAKELNVEGIVEGTVLRSGRRVRVTAQLLHGPSDRHLWASSYERDLRDVLILQKELAESIANEICGQLKTPPRRERKSASRYSVGAYDAYLKGRYCWNQRTEEGLNKSIEFYRQALSKDSRYALAYAGLADSYALLGSRRLGGIVPSQAMFKAQEAAKKALGLDETLAEAHLSLAFVKFQFEWDWAGAEKEFCRAIDLSPNSATSHYRNGMYLATMSRMSEAMSELNRARELDPLSPIVLTAQGRLLHFQRRYDDAIEWHRKALAISPNFVEAHFNLGMVYEQKSMFPEAISQFGKVSRIAGTRASFWSAGLGHAYGLAGMSKQARNILKQLLEVTSPLSPISPFDIAWVYLGLGEKDAALTWMDTAFAERCTPLVYQDIEPALDPLRSDPRFQNLLQRMKLSH